MVLRIKVNSHHITHILNKTTSSLTAYVAVAKHEHFSVTVYAEIFLTAVYSSTAWNYLNRFVQFMVHVHLGSFFSFLFFFTTTNTQGQ